MAKTNREVSEEDTIRYELQEIHDRLNSIEVTLAKLTQAVIGDKAFGQKGLVEQVNEHRKYIENDKALKNKFIGGSLVIGVIWTALLKFWDKIFS
jgi:hypothetical protein